MQKHVATAVADMAATCATGSNSTFTACVATASRHADGEDTQQGDSYSISPALPCSPPESPHQTKGKVASLL